MFANMRLHTKRSSAYVTACYARLGNDRKAREHAAECLLQDPGFSVRQFMSKEPFRNQADADYLADGLRLGGLPE